MNLIKSVFRNFRKFKLFTFLNLFGLALGLACVIVLFLYVGFQFSFDEFHADKDRIFRVSEIFTSPDKKEISPNVRIPVGLDLKDRYAEIESFCRIRPNHQNDFMLFKEKSIALNNSIYADSSFFSLFSFDLELGSPGSVLKDDKSIVLVHKIAKQLFDGQNPIGKIVKYNNKEYIVTGIAKDVPLNSHIQFDAILPFHPVLRNPDFFVGWNGGMTAMTFVKLQQAGLKEVLESKIPDLLWEKVNKKNKDNGFFTEFELEPLSKIHLYSKVGWDVFGKEEYRSIMVLLLIGCLVLVIALINYLFISRGILTLRLKEFGIRKYLGITKHGIFKQLLSETLILFFSAGLLSILVLVICKNVVTQLFGQDFISFLLGKSSLIIFLFIIILSISASYILYLSFYRKITKFSSNNFKISPYRNKRIAYVSAFQFVISITLITSVLFIYKQLHFALNKDLGFKSENIINLFHSDIGKKSDALLNEFEKIPGVVNASASFGIPGLETTQNGYQAEGSENWKMYNAMYVDDNFFKIFNLELINGRNFKKGRDLDKDVFIVNETLAKELNWENPIGKKIIRDGEHEIIGIVKDFHVGSIYDKIPPLIISKDWQDNFYTMSVAMKSENIPNTLKQIEEAWLKVMPNTAFNFSFLDDKFEALYKKVQQTIKILIIFSSLSILISMLGLFGITFLTINSKIKELGIRKVNGAKTTEIMIMLNRNLVKWVAFAFLIASPITWYAMNKWLESFAYKTNLSWWIFVLGGVLAFAIAIVTVSWQTWRAARRNPVVALRYE